MLIVFFIMINHTALQTGSELLEKIHERIDGCVLCPLGQCQPTYYVPGMGTQKAALLFVGEGPGKQEDLKGLPFVGASGKFLDHLLQLIGLRRDAIYITNVVKCRPPDNRDPTEEERKVCAPYLDEQICLIQPKIVVTLGRYSLAHFLPGTTIGTVHGQPKRRTSDGIIVFPCYHPAVALYNGSMRSVLEEDFRKLGSLLALLSVS